MTLATPAAITTPLTTLLRVRHPILLAPMGDSAGGRLAAAVSNAGAFGLIGGGYANPDWLARELELAAGARVGVGFITFGLDRRPDALRLALDAQPAAIQLSFGDPRPYVDDIKAAGALLICQVQSSEEVDLAVEAGADVLIAQGQDSGGHGRPDRGTIGLVPAMVDRVSPLPVVAAGGIADGRGLAAALMLGASGITMGTRFLATAEALTKPAEAQRLVAGRAEDTVRTPAFDVVRGPAWPEGHDGRALRNELTERWRDEWQVDDEQLDRVRTEFNATAPDDYSMRPVWAGEGLDLIDAIVPAAEVVEAVIAEAVTRLRGARALLEEPSPSRSDP